MAKANKTNSEMFYLHCIYINDKTELIRTEHDSTATLHVLIISIILYTGSKETQFPLDNGQFIISKPLAARLAIGH